jgi:hypothetical protein
LGHEPTLPWFPKPYKTLERLSSDGLYSSMFKIKLACSGINPAVGKMAAEDIEAEFRDRRPWHQEVTCRFEDGRLMLHATNDFDEAGLALIDEFSDCLSAYLKEHAVLRVVSVEAV